MKRLPRKLNVMNAPLPSLSMMEISEIPNDHFTQLQLRVARRADELVRAYSGNPPRDCWLDAEREILQTSILCVGVANTT